jgi:hypothetical protein
MPAPASACDSPTQNMPGRATTSIMCTQGTPACSMSERVNALRSTPVTSKPAGRCVSCSRSKAASSLSS